MKYDAVILSYSKTPEHIKITKDCIDSLRNAKNKIGVNIFVIESYDPNIKYEGTKTIYWVGQNGFNYNESMNYGFSLTKEKYVFFFNNDLVFSDNWADNCYHVFNMGFDLFSIQDGFQSEKNGCCENEKKIFNYARSYDCISFVLNCYSLCRI